MPLPHTSQELTAAAILRNDAIDLSSDEDLANGKLQIFKAEVGRVKPLIDEVVDDCHVKERQIVEDLCFFFALD